MRLAVDDPEIREVMDLRTVECRRTEDVVGEDQAAVSQLRLEISTGIHLKGPHFAGTMCGVPVRLARSVAGARHWRAERARRGRYLPGSDVPD